MRPTRRQTLAGLGGVSALLLAGPAFASRPVTLVEPYGPGSSTGMTAGLLAGGMGRSLGAEVTVRAVEGEAGLAALREVAGSPPDGSTLLVTQLLSPLADGPDTPNYRAMTGIARLTTGISAALVVSHSSPLADYAAFAERARAGGLRLAHNPVLLFALPLAMLEAEFGRFGDVLADTRAKVIAAVDGGAADAGFLPTISLLTADGRPPLRPLLTFGGTRSPWFPDVPTYREVGTGVRTAITGAIALFGPPGMEPGVRDEILAATRAAAEDRQVKADVAALRYPFAIDGPDVLVEMMDRNSRVVRDMRPFMRG